MTYPYGTHPSPAVGGGLPGLPRRESSGSTQHPQSVDLSDYTALVLEKGSSATIKKYNYKGDVLGESAAFDNSAPTAFNLSFDEKYLAVRGESDLRLFDVETLGLLSHTTGAANSSGVDVCGKLGLVAYEEPANYLSVSTIEDFISNNGSGISNVPTLVSTRYGGAEISFFRWNPSGTLLAVGFYGGTGSRLLRVFKWPSMDLAFSTDDNRYSSYFKFDFSPDGRYFAYSETVNATRLFLTKLEYGGDGQFVSSSDVFSELRGGGKLNIGGWGESVVILSSTYSQGTKSFFYNDIEEEVIVEEELVDVPRADAPQYTSVSKDGLVKILRTESDVLFSYKEDGRLWPPLLGNFCYRVITTVPSQDVSVAIIGGRLP